MKCSVIAADPVDDEGLEVRGDCHPVIAGYLYVIHVPLDVGGVSITNGGHRIHVLYQRAGVGPDVWLAFHIWGKQEEDIRRGVCLPKLSSSPKGLPG